jgi:hypothetical protein
MMKEIRSKIRNLLFEFTETTTVNELKDELISRVPFFKDFEDFSSEDKINLQRIVHNKEHVLYGKDGEPFNFKQYNFVSEFKYFKSDVNDNTRHYFFLRNDIAAMPSKEMDNLYVSIFMEIFKQISKKHSTVQEFVLPIGQEITQEQLSEVINELNKKMFEFEEHCQKTGLDLF